MFKKVLVAEDMDDIYKGINSILCELKIDEIHQVQYCDDAYLKVKNGVLVDSPYDLLITDLTFKRDYRNQKYSSGQELIQALKKDNSNLKIIAYSVDDRIHTVRRLTNVYKINAYVCKGRTGLEELSKAIKSVFNNENFISAQVENALKNMDKSDVSDFDIELIKQLSYGLSQEDISDQFKQQNISPASISTIEKRINKLRIQFKAKNVTHLIAIVKDLGLI